MAAIVIAAVEDAMPKNTRRYTIRVKDVAAKRDVMFTAADWTKEELRIAVGQIARLIGAPDNNCFGDEVAPQRPRRWR